MLGAHVLRSYDVQDLLDFLVIGLELLQGQAPELLVLGVFLVPLADFAVEVPAVVVEGLGQGGDLLEGHLPKVHEADDNVVIGNKISKIWLVIASKPDLIAAIRLGAGGSVKLLSLFIFWYRHVTLILSYGAI